MGLKNDARSVTFMKARAAELLEQINRDQRPVVITQNGEPRAVMLAPDTYDRMRRAIGLLKLIALGEQDIRAGKTQAHDALFARLARKYRPQGADSCRVRCADP